ncbi:hypothetical protein M3Y97_01119500 [Aphelenchoides bicaudatus]|nr:hypothetical protein M3Y97_01119500 [Aphelenchoides bicaudatus]
MNIFLVLLFVLNVNSLNECYFCGKQGVSCDSPIVQECPYPNSGCYKGVDNYGILTVAGCGPKETLIATGYKIDGCLSDDIGTMCTCFTGDMCNK